MNTKRDETLKTGERYHLPLPTGPFANIGFVDIMTGTGKDDGVFVRVLYPAADQSIDIKRQSNEWVNWLPHKNYLDGYVKMSEINWKPIIKLMKCLSSDVFIPIVENQNPLRPNDHTFPVIIFSHGAGSCRASYSDICYEMASFGFIVFAVEHRDETANITFFPDQNGSEPFKWVLFKHLENLNDFEIRQKQVNQRVDEIKKTIDLMNDLNEGNRVNNVLDIKIDNEMFVGLFDMNKIIVMGHSFGGATVIKSLLSVDQIKLGICLDVWMLPVKDVDASQVTKPLLFVNAENFRYKKKKNLTAIKKFIGENGTNTDRRKVITIRGAKHIDQSDSPFVINSFIQWILSIKPSVNPFLVHDLTTALALYFIEDHFRFKLEANKKKFIEENRNQLIEGIAAKDVD